MIDEYCELKRLKEQERQIQRVCFQHQYNHMRDSLEVICVYINTLDARV